MDTETTENEDLKKQIKDYENKIQLLKHEIDARKLAQDGLREGQLFLQTVLSSVFDRFILVFDKNLIINFCWGPEKLESKYGIKFSDFMGKNIKEMLPNVQNEEKINVIDHILTNKESLDMEWNIEFPNGKFWIDISFSPVEDEEMTTKSNQIGTGSGIGLAVVTSVRDISEKKNVDRELKESEEIFRTIAEQSLISIIISVGQKIVYINKNMSALSGISEEKLLSTNISNFLSLIHPEDLNKLTKGIEKRKEKGIYDNSFQFRFRNTSGQYVWMQQFTRPIQIKGEYALLSILVDINHLKQMEFKLIKNEKFLDLVFNNLNQAISVLDPMDFHIITANKVFLSLNKVTAKEIEGKSCFEIIHRKNSPCFLQGENCPAKEAVNQEKTISRQHIHKNDEGDQQYYEINVVPVLNKNEEIEYLLHIERNITQRILLEKKIMDVEISHENDLKPDLAQILLERLPCVALILEKGTRRVVASNKAGKEAGAIPGTCCYGTWGKRENPCPWCMAPKVWEIGKVQNIEIEALGIIWDAYWVPIDENHYLHYAFNITERRNSERFLQRSQELAFIGYWEWDFFTNEIKVSDELKRILGIEHKDLRDIFKKIVELINPEDKEEFLKLRENIYNKIDLKNIKPFTCKIDLENGMQKHIYSELNTIFDHEHRPIRVIGIVQDITDKVKSTEEINYRAQLIENAYDAILSTKMNYEIVSWNKSAEDLYLWKAEEVKGKNIIDILKNNYPNQKREHVQKFFQTNGFWKGEIIQERKDGKKIHVMASTSLIKDSKGNSVGVVVINRDLTEFKLIEQKYAQNKGFLSQTEEALRESWSIMRAILENTPDNILLVDKDGEIQFINRDFLSIKVSKFLGQKIFDFLPSSDANQVKISIEQVFLNGVAEDLKLTLKDQSGKKGKYNARFGFIKNEFKTTAVLIIFSKIK